jgi:APA family basic amino acid/polyamine antiporter
MSHRYAQLFATKSIETLVREANAGSGLKRTLGPLDLILLGVGVILGTGIFVVTGRAAAQSAGPAVIISFAIAGFAAGLAALCYAEMGSMLPISGSAYTYAYATMGELIAFVIGWTLILEWVVSAALVAAGWSGYFTALLRTTFNVILAPRWCNAPLAYDMGQHSFVGTGAVINLPAVLFTAFITAILIPGMKQSARFNAAVVAIKFSTIGLFLFFAARHMKLENLTPFIPPNRGEFGQFGLSGVMQGATMVYLSFIGFDAVTTTAQEAKNPQRDIPLGTLSSVGICTLFYILVAFVLTGVVPYEELAVPDSLARGLQPTGLLWLQSVVSMGAVIGLSSCLLGALVAQPRIFLAMSRDGMLPKSLGRIHARFGTPHVGTAVTGVCCSVLAGIFPIDVLGEMASTGTLVIFFLVSVCVMILRVRQPHQPRRFKVPGGTFFLPLLSATISAVLIVAATGPTKLRLLVWMVTGVCVYAAYGYRNSQLRVPRPKQAQPCAPLRNGAAG